MDNRKILKEFRRLSGISLNENNSSVRLKNFPKDIRDTLDNEYSHFYVEKYDWNSKQDEMGEKMGDWLEQHENEGFLKNIDKVIKATTQDLILKKRQDMSERKLRSFESLIKPTLGNDVLVPVLTKYEEEVLMDPNATPQSIEAGFKEAKNIIDNQGNLDHKKIEQSKIFTGGDINLPNFERFVSANPEYKGVFNDWKKLFDENMNLSLRELNAYRDSTSIDRIRDLRNYLIQFKKKNL